ncbi:MAG TPA: hypothetical protein VLU99_05440 [Nitrososphaerales archaeon]|nr:hypothetical protein [Nitrososphaerales archaeon]HUK75218.1 hypothetical protein [Nitrososphaerales archaeon]
MRLAGLFSDYDGTLAPVDVPAASSRIPESVARPLRALGTKVPVAIVTSKDHSFIRPRTPFASAWACVSGLEIVMRDGRDYADSTPGLPLRQGLDLVRRQAWTAVRLELKRSIDGRLLGFSIDWRGSRPPRRLGQITAELEALGLHLVRDPSWPFVDVFGAVPDKGRAVARLGRLLAIEGTTLFLGDSLSDNPAFHEADVSIGVDHGQPMESLDCEFTIRRDEVPGFLASLAKANLSLDVGNLRRRDKD